MKPKLLIYWARRDFRIRDNRALYMALKKSCDGKVPLLPLYFIEPYMQKGDPRYQFGLPQRTFLSKALPLFAQRFPHFVCIQSTITTFFKKLSTLYALEIYVNEDVYPDFYAQLKKLTQMGISVSLYKDQLTISKDTRTESRNLYSVFTPFKNKVWNEFIAEKEISIPLQLFKNATWYKPKRTDFSNTVPITEKHLQGVLGTSEILLVGKHTIDLKNLVLPKKEYRVPYLDEQNALKHFKLFLPKISTYKESRDFLDQNGTSGMSLALSWGLISSRTMIHHIHRCFGTESTRLNTTSQNEGILQFTSELIWREFYKYLCFHHPKLFVLEFQEKMRGISWVTDKEALHRFKLWVQGQTGYPLVDAAMMELATTGFMHNRARMVVSSILTKNLGVDWRWGQEYFRATLLDLDETSNNGGWQWGASVGADPKPIRIFNPLLQAQKYDPEKKYQNTWLNESYFKSHYEPIIPHKEARQLAIERYKNKTSL